MRPPTSTSPNQSRWTLAWLALGAFACISPARAQVNFDAPRTFDVGAPSPVLASGDLDNDSVSDLVVVTLPNTLTTFLGKGDGLFERRFEVPTVYFASQVRILDLDRDRNLDLVILGVDRDGRSVRVDYHLGSGNGAFATSGTVVLPPERDPLPHAFVDFADLDKDGWLDLILGAGKGLLHVYLGSSDNTYTPTRIHAIDREVWAVTHADFDKDGTVEIVTANRNCANVTFVLNPTSSTPTLRHHVVQTAPHEVVVTDIDKDGFLDLVTWSLQAHSLLIRRGRDATTFAVGMTVDLPKHLFDVELADMNNDGNIDIVSLTKPPQGSGDVTIHESDGRGGFSSISSIQITRPQAFSVTDVNSDGLMDVAVADTRGTVHVFVQVRGSTTGELPEGSIESEVGSVNTYPWLYGAARVPGPGIGDMIAADLNQDGRMDCLTSRVIALINEGPAGFRTWSPPEALAAAGPMASGDFDRDGVLDVAVAGANNTVLIYRGVGDGSFSLTARLPSGTRGLAVGDVDSDGDLDLLGGARWASLFAGDGAGRFFLAAQPRFEATPVDVALTDLNNDGRHDFVGIFPGASTEDPWILKRGLARGLGFDSFEDYVLSGPASELQVLDVNRDGNPDVVTANGLSPGVSVFLGIGDGRFRERADYAVPQTSFVRGADVNADGHPDILVSDGRGSVLLGVGDGTFTIDEMDVHPSTGPLRLIYGDFNADGTNDLIAAQFGLFILLGHDEGYGLQEVHRTERFPRSPLIADFNGDGRPDIAVLNEGSDSIWTFENHGEITFSLAQAVHTRAGPARGIAQDLDGDGAVDIVVNNARGASVLVHPGTGDGRFKPYHRVATLSAPSDLVVDDLDGDELLDICVASGGSDEVVYLRGNGEFQYETRVGRSSGFQSAIEALDLNDDGFLDVVLGNHHCRSFTTLFVDSTGFVEPRVDLEISPPAFQIEAVELDFNNDPDLILIRGSGLFVCMNVRTNGLTAGTMIDHARRFAVGDVDGDGLHDIVAVNGRNVVYRGHGDGTFSELFEVMYPGETGDVALGDLNQDGQIDLVLTDPGSNLVSVTPNLAPHPAVSAQDIASLFAAQVTRGRIDFTWSLAAELLDRLEAVRIERSGSTNGPFVSVSPPLPPRTVMAFRLQPVPDATTRWYRLAVDLKVGTSRFTIPVRVDEAAALGFDLSVTTAGGLARIRYALARPVDDLELRLFDVRGRLVRNLARGAHPGGEHVIHWAGDDDAGRRAARGIYFLQLRAGPRTLTRRLVSLPD